MFETSMSKDIPVYTLWTTKTYITCLFFERLEIKISQFLASTVCNKFNWSDCVVVHRTWKVLLYCLVKCKTRLAGLIYFFWKSVWLWEQLVLMLCSNLDFRQATSQDMIHTHTQPFYGSMELVRENPGEPVPEETFTHYSHRSHQSSLSAFSI